jgi:hypothetical protein
MSGRQAEATILGEFQAEDPMLDATLKEMFLVQAEQRNTQLAAGKLEFLYSQLGIAERENSIAGFQTSTEKRRKLLTPELLELEMRINSLGPDLVALTGIVRDISHATVPQFVGAATLPQGILHSIMRQVDDLNRRTRASELASGQLRRAIDEPDEGHR